MEGTWGIHRAHLRALLAECYDLGAHLTRAGGRWWVRFIYRDFNTVADRLATAAREDPANAGYSARWR